MFLATICEGISQPVPEALYIYNKDIVSILGKDFPSQEAKCLAAGQTANLAPDH